MSEERFYLVMWDSGREVEREKVVLARSARQAIGRAIPEWDNDLSCVNVTALPESGDNAERNAALGDLYNQMADLRAATATSDGAQAVAPDSASPGSPGGGTVERTQE